MRRQPRPGKTSEGADNLLPKGRTLVRTYVAPSALDTIQKQAADFRLTLSSHVGDILENHATKVSIFNDLRSQWTPNSFHPDHYAQHVWVSYVTALGLIEKLSPKLVITDLMFDDFLSITSPFQPRAVPSLTSFKAPFKTFSDNLQDAYNEKLDDEACGIINWLVQVLLVSYRPLTGEHGPIPIGPPIFNPTVNKERWRQFATATIIYCFVHTETADWQKSRLK